MSEQRAKLEHELGGPGVVVGNTRFLVHQALPASTWQYRVGSGGSVAKRDDKEPTENLNTHIVRSVMQVLGGEDGIHGEELRILVSENLTERLAGIVEVLRRRPGIDVNAEDLERDGGFAIGNVVFRIDRSMDGPVWRFSPNGVVHGQSTLTRDTILQQIEKADGRPLEVLAAPNLADDLLKVTREVLAEAIRRGWTITPGTTTFSAEKAHAISGLTTHEADVLQHVLGRMREADGDGAVVTLDAEEKALHEAFVKALEAGLVPVYLNRKQAGYCIRHNDQGDAVLVFGETPDVRAARHLASGIDQGLRAIEPPLRSVSFSGLVAPDENGDLRIGEKDVIQSLAGIDESQVGFDLACEATGAHLELAGLLDVLEPVRGGEPGESEPGWLKVSGLDVIAILDKFVGQEVVMSVAEAARPSTIQPTAEGEPKTPEEDLVGKIRVALSAGKLIQANRRYHETPDGQPDLPGTPSRKNDTAVDRLTEAMAWAEQDSDEKGRPAE